MNTAPHLVLRSPSKQRIPSICLHTVDLSDTDTTSEISMMPGTTVPLSQSREVTLREF